MVVVIRAQRVARGQRPQRPVPLRRHLSSFSRALRDGRVVAVVSNVGYVLAGLQREFWCDNELEQSPRNEGDVPVVPCCRTEYAALDYEGNMEVEEQVATRNQLVTDFEPQRPSSPPCDSRCPLSGATE